MCKDGYSKATMSDNIGLLPLHRQETRTGSMLERLKIIYCWHFKAMSPKLKLAGIPLTTVIDINDSLQM